MGYKQNFIDSDKLFFEDSFNGESFSLATSEPFMNGLRVHFFDLSSGVLLFTDKFYFGFAANHLNTPNQSLVFGDSILPKFGVHGGGHFHKDNQQIGRKHNLYYPFLSYNKESTQLTVNNNVKTGNFLVGGGFRFVEGYSLEMH